jgi:hypothetical protein
VKHDPSRKHFFAKLFGMAAAFGVVPQLLAKVLPAREAAPETVAEKLPVQVRPEARAVARRGDAV